MLFHIVYVVDFIFIIAEHDTGMSNEVSLSPPRSQDLSGGENVMDMGMTVQQLHNQTLHASSENNENSWSPEQIVPQVKIIDLESNSPSSGGSADGIQTYCINACVPATASSPDHQTMIWTPADIYLNGDFTPQLNEQRTMHWVIYISFEKYRMNVVLLLKLCSFNSSMTSKKFIM